MYVCICIHIHTWEDKRERNKYTDKSLRIINAMLYLMSCDYMSNSIFIYF